MKYSAITSDGLFIESDNLEHFRLEELTSFMVTEKMTEEEVRKKFGRDYELPKDLKDLKTPLYLCQSYIEGGELKNCTCGECF